MNILHNNQNILSKISVRCILMIDARAIFLSSLWIKNIYNKIR